MRLPQEYEEYVNKYRDTHLYTFEEEKSYYELVFIKRYAVVSEGPLHRHTYFQINYVAQGSGSHHLVNNRFDIHKGDIFIIPPYIPHKITAEPGQACQIVEFEFAPEFISQNFASFEDVTSFLDFAYVEPFLVSENKLKPRLTLSGKLQFEVEGLLSEAEEEFERKESGYLLLIRAVLLRLLILLGREYNKLPPAQTTARQHSAVIWQAVQYVKEHCAEKLTLEALSAHFNFSPSYFSYLFSHVTSRSFSDYLIGVRIDKARELLANTDCTIAQVGEEVGFQDVRNFYRCFRQRTGLTPGAYRQAADGQPPAV